jgi:hypothetical protein
MDELQEALKAISRPLVPPKKKKSWADLLFSTAASERAKGFKTNSKTPPETTSDAVQWSVRPNGVFMPSSSTVSALPPGVYELGIDGDGMVYFTYKTLTTDTLIDLEDSASARVINGIKHFWKQRDRYDALGLIFKRGILMWGPPGSGKTATLTLLMEDLVSQGGTVFIIKHPGMAKAAMTKFRSIEPDRPMIIVFEDIDEIIRQYGEHEILAILDGENQTDNVVSIATTNYPEELGARIVNRPSRFDEVIKVDMPSAKMRKEYLAHLLEGLGEGDFPFERALIDTDRLSISHIKELVVAVTCLDQPYDAVIKRLQTMKVQPKSQQFEGKVGFND